MDALVEAHRRLAGLLGSRIEPIEVWRRAEEHRAYWRPVRVRVILLAESHVHTTASELERKVILPGMPGNDLPRGFVRLVYCLGYGENDLLDHPFIPGKDNPGTPHYWKIFYSCINLIQSNADFAPVLKQTPFQQRIKNKLALLRRLKEAGVWLVDTSLAALYPKPDHHNHRRVPANKLGYLRRRRNWRGAPDSNRVHRKRSSRRTGRPPIRPRSPADRGAATERQTDL